MGGEVFIGWRLDHSMAFSSTRAGLYFCFSSSTNVPMQTLPTNNPKMQLHVIVSFHCFINPKMYQNKRKIGFEIKHKYLTQIKHQK